MAEEIITDGVVEDANETQKYLDTIADLKKNSVSRQEYDKIRNENKTLLEAIVNGRTADDAAADSTTPTPTTQDLRNKIFGKEAEDLSDIEFVSGLLDLRDKLLEEEGIDYMAPTGGQIAADYNDLQTSQKAYNALRHCLEVADGDNDIFIQEITRITNDVMPIRKPNTKRR